MSDQNRFTVTEAEVLGVNGGVDESTGQPVVVLTLRLITGSGWGHVNYSLHPDNACSLLDRLNREFDTSPCLKPDPPDTTARPASARGEHFPVRRVRSPRSFGTVKWSWRSGPGRTPFQRP